MSNIETASWQPSHLVKFIDYKFEKIVDLKDLAGHCQPECRRPIRYEVHIAPPIGGASEIIGRICYERLLLLKMFGIENFKVMWEIDRRKTARVGLYILRQKLEPGFEFDFAILGERLEDASLGEKKRILNDFYEELKKKWRSYRQSITREEREQHNRQERDTMRSKQEQEREKRRGDHLAKYSQLIVRINAIRQSRLVEWDLDFVETIYKQLTEQLWDLSPQQVEKFGEIEEKIKKRTNSGDHS